MLFFYITFVLFWFYFKVIEVGSRTQDYLENSTCHSKALNPTVRIMEGCLEEVVYKQSYKELGGTTQEENKMQSKVPSK